LFAEAQKHAVDFVLHTGDVAYPDGSFDDYERTVFAVYAPLFARAPFYPSLGNHDDVTDNGAPFRALFGDAHGSFDWGSAHFVTLDSNDVSAEQTAWLQKDLAASRARFKVVYFHHPAYSSGPHGDSAEVKANWVPLFDQYKVDLVLAGHDHVYERFFPLRAGARDDTGTLYITTGGGGAELYPRKTEHANSALFQQKHHFVLLDASDCRMEISAVAIGGLVLDHTSIDKCVTAK
jgi:3',5'-cyclic AMP phosphodiesterase CpdA